MLTMSSYHDSATRCHTDECTDPDNHWAGCYYYRSAGGRHYHGLYADKSLVTFTPPPSTIVSTAQGPTATGMCSLRTR